MIKSCAENTVQKDLLLIGLYMPFLILNVDAVGEQSPSLVTRGNSEWKDLDKDETSTQHQHCVSVLVGCDNDSNCISTSEEVYDSINQDQLFADNDNNSTTTGKLPAFLGIALARDENDDDSFNKIDETNIILSALY